MRGRTYSLRGAAVVTPDEVLTHTDLTIWENQIAAWGKTAVGCGVDLRDYLIFPGLINAHDHLNGTWWPRVGPSRPYVNVYQWLTDLDGSPTRYDRMQNSVQDVYDLGMYRNLISGVTTVADHFKRIDGAAFYTRHPIHVLYEYGRTWTPREQTAWGGDVWTEYEYAVRSRQPYIIHLAEGLDHETMAEMDILVGFNAVGRNTLIIHGVSLRPQDMRLMARVGASLCWCPASNRFLYGQTADVLALLAAGVNVTLGTDSSLTGGLNLLDELRTAQWTWQELTGAPPSDRWLVELVTMRAAQALMLEGRRGRIAPGYEADLVIVPDQQSSPYAGLIAADISDIALVICAGVPVYGDVAYQSLFEQFSPGFKPVRVSGRSKLIAGDVMALLDRISETVGRMMEFPFLPCTTME